MSQPVNPSNWDLIVLLALIGNIALAAANGNLHAVIGWSVALLFKLSLIGAAGLDNGSKTS